MIKHMIALVLLSILVVFLLPHAGVAMEYLVRAHDFIAEMLKAVFSGGQIGDVIRQLIALLVIPLFVGLIPAFIYWLARRAWFPYFMPIVWVVWLLQVSALMVVHQAGST